MNCKLSLAQKKCSFGARTVVNSHQAGVLKWIIGDRSSKTFCRLWWIVRGWCCFLYITDGYPVNPLLY